MTLGTFDRHEVVLLLGPTNTGKTFRAIERLLDHDTGIIGLPLRLLAREVYDRVVARVGEEHVALVTGEEKRVPRRARYWIATVEAMPMDREVDFIAVDEIQLCGHAERGHVFTDRLLNARGRKETWFLGSHAAETLLRSIVPAARVESNPRLSSLRYLGTERLGRLPKRTALVAFSMREVYRLAERVRVTHGGAAVVMGALSPRTRNAQVAMFEAGDVDYLVATDAIGMGLNLDVHHVAFSALSKFDGREERELEPAEVAQIAGRAGRYLRDGTFGALSPREIPHRAAQAIEAHVLPPVKRAFYRNSRLEFGSLNTLFESLRAPTANRSLVPFRDALDERILARVGPDLASSLHDESDIRLLWDVAQIPDYRKLLFESHVELIKRIFALLREGPISDAEMEKSVHHLRHVQGDESVLVDRIADTRTWTYISHHRDWVENAERWQEETRALEDTLSEQLHQCLLSRFVDTNAKRKKLRPLNSFAALASRLESAPSLEEVAPPRVELDAAGGFDGDGDRIANLARGANILKPAVKWHVSGETRARFESLVAERTRDMALGLIDGLTVLRAEASLRGIVYGLEQGLGSLLIRDDEVLELSADRRTLLAASGLTWGKVTLYAPSSLTDQARDIRQALADLWFGCSMHLPAYAGRMQAMQTAQESYLLARGYLLFAPFVVRIDVLEEGLIPVLENVAPRAAVRDALGMRAGEFDALMHAVAMKLE